MIDISFEWKRAHEYECVRVRGHKWLRAIGKGRENFEPLKIEMEKPLYLWFADLDGSEESCLRFARVWGLLTTESPAGEEMLETWQEQIQAMRQAREFFGPIDTLPAELARKRRAGEAWKLTNLDMLLVPKRAEADRFAMMLQPRNLLAAMYVQLAKSVAGGGSLRNCKQCGEWFETGASDSRRSIAIFCSEKCKNRFHYLGRAKR
jgi:hypothetical protein